MKNLNDYNVDMKTISPSSVSVGQYKSLQYKTLLENNAVYYKRDFTMIDEADHPFPIVPQLKSWHIMPVRRVDSDSLYASFRYWENYV